MRIWTVGEATNGSIVGWVHAVYRLIRNGLVAMLLPLLRPFSRDVSVNCCPAVSARPCRSQERVLPRQEFAPIVGEGSPPPVIWLRHISLNSGTIGVRVVKVANMRPIQ